MICRKARKLLLLADAGELTAADEKALQRHLAGCPACRRYQASLQALRGEYHAESAVEATPLPPPTLNAILSAARERAPADEADLPVTPASGTWIRWAALAAIGLLIAATVHRFIGLHRLSPPPQAVETRLAEHMTQILGELEAEWTAWEREMVRDSTTLERTLLELETQAEEEGIGAKGDVEV